MFATRRTGWIGIDIGTSTVKAAQVVRNGRQLRLAAAAVVPRRKGWPIADLSDQPAISSADQIRAALSLRANFRGSRVAATLPMALCDVHVLDRTFDTELHQDRIIRQAIETATQRSADHLQFDAWTVEEPDNGRSGRTNIITAPQTWTDQLCEDIARAGGSCQAIDGLPLALARAVGMIQQGSHEAPAAALDWGFGRATFCLIVDSRPVYVRCLKECGFQRSLEAIAEHLQVTQDEAQRLLVEHGLPGPTDNESIDTAKVLEKLLAEPLNQLEEEVRRTISHLKIQRRMPPPHAIYLLGGGAATRGIDSHLAARLRTPVHVWQLAHDAALDTQHGALPISLFGPAAALSALAWEKS